MLTANRTLLVIGSAADGLLGLRTGLVEPAQATGWQVAVTVTPTAATWLSATGELDALERATGFPVRHRPRTPGEVSPHPVPDCVALVPASANTVAKLALGLSDNQALTTACEALGGGQVPIVVFPRINSAHAGQPAWPGHVDALRRAGVHLVIGPEVWPLLAPGVGLDKQPPWAAIMAAIESATT